MRRQRAKRPSVPEVSSYRGRGLRQAAPWLAAAPALPGLMLILIRPLGMRFSGFLLVALAAVLLAEVYLRRWAGRARAGWWVQLAFRAALALVLARMKHVDWAKKIAAGLCVVALVLFVLYYPALSGLPIPAWWADALNALPSFGFY